MTERHRSPCTPGATDELLPTTWARSTAERTTQTSPSLLAPTYVLDEIDARRSSEDEDDDFELDLTAEAPLTTDSLQQFLNEAGRYPLLTAAEEVELAKRIERGDWLRRSG